MMQELGILRLTWFGRPEIRHNRNLINDRDNLPLMSISSVI